MSAAVVRSGVSEPSSASGAGAEWGRYLLGRPEATGARVPSFRESWRALGFQATVTRGRATACPGCPCPIVAPDHPELVYGLADAVVEGVLG